MGPRRAPAGRHRARGGTVRVLRTEEGATQTGEEPPHVLGHRERL